MLREGEKKSKSVSDQTENFHSSEQAANLVNRKLDIQTKGRGNVWGRLGLGQNCEVGKVWLQNPAVAPLSALLPAPGRICLDVSEEKRNMALPPSQPHLLHLLHLRSLVPPSLSVICPITSLLLETDPQEVLIVKGTVNYLIITSKL